MLIGGVAFSLVLTPLTTAALAGVPIQNAGMGAAVINATRQVGGLLGLAVMGAISAAEIERSLREGNAGVEAFVDSFETLMLVAASVSLLGAVRGGADRDGSSPGSRCTRDGRAGAG